MEVMLLEDKSLFVPSIIFIVVREDSLNAPPPIVVTLDGSAIDVNISEENASFPIVVTLEGMVMLGS